MKNVKISIFDYILHRSSDVALLIYNSDCNDDIDINSAEGRFIKNKLTLKNQAWQNEDDLLMQGKISPKNNDTFYKEFSTLTSFFHEREKIFGRGEIKKIWLFEAPDFVIQVDNELVMVEVVWDMIPGFFEVYDENKTKSEDEMILTAHSTYKHKVNDSAILKHINVEKLELYRDNISKNGIFASLLSSGFEIKKIVLLNYAKGFDARIDETRELLEHLKKQESSLNKSFQLKNGFGLTVLLNWNKLNWRNLDVWETLDEVLKNADTNENE